MPEQTVKEQVAAVPKSDLGSVPQDYVDFNNAQEIHCVRQPNGSWTVQLVK
ncbi:hypothetical protein [Azospirillum isscasi]|uniref:Uncharacterized protein n=1 Tax=Azospirillum isscasi TaxID=3053926 RepID=A0ABU0WHU2_9PROT|nr:hypothetical protein [Azospirillum isscasi]MDQ2103783.1 hypothetical protein [Azospirillum isscasi]